MAIGAQNSVIIRLLCDVDLYKDIQKKLMRIRLLIKLCYIEGYLQHVKNNVFQKSYSNDDRGSSPPESRTCSNGNHTDSNHQDFCTDEIIKNLNVQEILWLCRDLGSSDKESSTRALSNIAYCSSDGSSQWPSPFSVGIFQR